MAKVGRPKAPRLLLVDRHRYRVRFIDGSVVGARWDDDARTLRMTSTVSQRTPGETQAERPPIPWSVVDALQSWEKNGDPDAPWYTTGSVFRAPTVSQTPDAPGWIHPIRRAALGQPVAGTAATLDSYRPKRYD